MTRQSFHGIGGRCWYLGLVGFGDTFQRYSVRRVFFLFIYLHHLAITLLDVLGLHCVIVGRLRFRFGWGVNVHPVFLVWTFCTWLGGRCVRRVTRNVSNLACIRFSGRRCIFYHGDGGVIRLGNCLKGLGSLFRSAVFLFRRRLLCKSSGRASRGTSLCVFIGILLLFAILRLGNLNSDFKPLCFGPAASLGLGLGLLATLHVIPRTTVVGIVVPRPFP
mmetsp:Transcript_55296/g.135666  ORF Transcript_55296/g.135666 Transcript_55296/m.135666 type:complete len:219 (-) Transcript_55296:5-661(-)